MKIKTFIAIATILFCGINANATDYVLYESWNNCSDGKLPEGWNTVGTDKTPSGYAASYFEYGDGMKVMTLPGSLQPYAVSYSTTLEGGKVDTKLITPEFTVPSSGAILSFTAVNYDPEGSVANKIGVFAVDKSSITEESIFTVRVPSNNVGEPANYTLSLDDYAGHEISLIIVNEGSGAGLLGIGTIFVSEYVGEIKDYTPLFTSVEESRKLKLEVGLLAPCKGFTATLTTSTGIEETYSSNKDLSEVYKYYYCCPIKNF